MYSFCTLAASSTGVIEAARQWKIFRSTCTPAELEIFKKEKVEFLRNQDNTTSDEEARIQKEISRIQKCVSNYVET